MAFVGNTPSAVPLTGSQIADGTIVNANIATNTINLTQKVTSALAATNGGTGTSSYTAGNILYASNATTLTTLAPGTSGYALTLNGTTPTWAAVGAAAGQVIQVVSATDSTARSTSSDSFVTASNTLSVSITPSSSSNKILLFAYLGNMANGSGGGYVVTIYRGATNVGNATYGLRWRSDANELVNLHYYDSPATTSSITYQIYFKRASTNGSTVLNYDLSKAEANSLCSLTAMEVKG